jgi:hypothetical protein
MQKDAHFYMTFAIARLIGFTVSDAKKIAWADQYTDDMTRDDMEKYGVQTQCDLLENWKEREVQYTVLIPFHFLPGDDPKYPWVTSPNSKLARNLVDLAIDERNLYGVGIALHALQDTFTHQGFSGWEEKSNSCYPWYYLKSALPNVGHTEMRTLPDMIDAAWTDPRTGQVIINADRAILAAQATYDALHRLWQNMTRSEATYKRPKYSWDEIRPNLKKSFGMSYDERKKMLREMASSNVRYSGSKSDTWMRKHKAPFIKAARLHLTRVLQHCVKLTTK